MVALLAKGSFEALQNESFFVPQLVSFNKIETQIWFRKYPTDPFNGLEHPDARCTIVGVTLSSVAIH